MSFYLAPPPTRCKQLISNNTKNREALLNQRLLKISSPLSYSLAIINVV